MISRALYIIILTIFFSCTQELVYNSTISNFDDRNIEWYYNPETQDLLIQIDVNNIGRDDIIDMKIRINPNNEFVEIFDDGQNNDQVPSNGIYSEVFNNIVDQSHFLEIIINMIDESVITYQYDIDFNQPSISSVVILNTVHSLHNLRWTDYLIKIAIDAPGGIEEIDDVKFYVKKQYFFESGELINNICEYGEPVTNDFWETYDGWSMDWEKTNSNGTQLYQTKIPMRPINQCGGYGFVFWKFQVSNKKGFYDILEYEQPVEICSGDCGV